MEVDRPTMATIFGGLEKKMKERQNQQHLQAEPHIVDTSHAI